MWTFIFISTGSPLNTSGGGCVINGKGSITATLPTSGTYTLVIDPTARTFGDATVRIRL